MEINDGHLSLQDTAVFLIYLTKSSCDFGPAQWREKGKCSPSLPSSPARRRVALLFARKGAGAQGRKALPADSFPFVRFKSALAVTLTRAGKWSRIDGGMIATGPKRSPIGSVRTLERSRRTTGPRIPEPLPVSMRVSSRFSCV